MRYILAELFITGTGTVNISDADFDSNTSQYGGTIYNNKGNIDITNSFFTGNNASTNGGVLYNTGKISIDNTEFQDNEAAKYGGVLYMDTSSNKSAEKTTITNSIFNGNTA